MTKLIAYNEKMLDVACAEMYRQFKEYGCLSVEFGKPFKEKTRNQNNFFWGAIVESVKDFFKQQGIEYSQEQIKDNFYHAIAPRKIITQFNGKQYETWKHISEMSVEEMSEFIDKSIWLCDNARAFQGLVLHPSIRYTWIRHITNEELRNMPPVKARKDAEYISYVRKQSCLCCGKYGCEAHHIKQAGITGTSYKADDWEAIPLCQDCHRAYHIKGKEWFEEQMAWLLRYISMTDFCKCCYNRWLLKK